MLQIPSKLKKWQWRNNFLKRRHRQFFWRCFVSLVKFSYWSKFHVIIITGSEVSIYKGFTRNLEIGNTNVWILPNTWRLGRARNTKFGAKFVSNKMLLNAAKYHSYSFWRFWVIKEKPIVRVGGGGQEKSIKRKVKKLYLSKKIIWTESRTKGCRQFQKMKQKRFLYGKTPKFGFWVVVWVPAPEFKYFREFLGISWFPMMPSRTSLGNSWGNSYFHFLVTIVYSSVSTVVKRNCAKTWKSLQIFCPKLQAKAWIKLCAWYFCWLQFVKIPRIWKHRKVWVKEWLRKRTTLGCIIQLFPDSGYRIVMAIWHS